jgi:flagellar assembly protein FliH/type III secretion protein L
VSFAGRARVLKKEAVDRSSATPLLPMVREETRRRIGKEAVSASLEAQRILAEAERRAEATLARAREEALHLASEAAHAAREQEVARLAAAFLALRVEDERRAERDLDRAVSLAQVLAERLLGEALAMDPGRIVALARQALSEAKGAQRARIEASPLDVEALRSHLQEIGLAEGTLDIKVDPLLSRGSLRIHTNLGSLDAQLTPQLERLAKALRDALTSAS